MCNNLPVDIQSKDKPSCRRKRVQGPVVQRVDDAIQQINVNKTNYTTYLIVISPVDKVIRSLKNRGQNDKCREGNHQLSTPVENSSDDVPSEDDYLVTSMRPHSKCNRLEVITKGHSGRSRG